MCDRRRVAAPVQRCAPRLSLISGMMTLCSLTPTRCVAGDGERCAAHFPMRLRIPGDGGREDPRLPVAARSPELLLEVLRLAAIAGRKGRGGCFCGDGDSVKLTFSSSLPMGVCSPIELACPERSCVSSNRWLIPMTVCESTEPAPLPCLTAVIPCVVSSLPVLNISCNTARLGCACG